MHDQGTERPPDDLGTALDAHQTHRNQFVSNLRAQHRSKFRGLGRAQRRRLIAAGAIWPARKIGHIGIGGDCPHDPSRADLIFISGHVVGLQAIGRIQRRAQQRVLTLAAGTLIFHAMPEAAIAEVAKPAARGHARAALYRAPPFRNHHRPLIGEAEHRTVGLRPQRPLPVVGRLIGRAALGRQPLDCIKKRAQRDVGNGLVVRRRRAGSAARKAGTPRPRP